MNTNIIEIF